MAKTLESSFSELPTRNNQAYLWARSSLQLVLLITRSNYEAENDFDGPQFLYINDFFKAAEIDLESARIGLRQPYFN